MHLPVRDAKLIQVSIPDIAQSHLSTRDTRDNFRVVASAKS